jgi:hypothetical protein
VKNLILIALALLLVGCNKTPKSEYIGEWVGTPDTSVTPPSMRGGGGDDEQADDEPSEDTDKNGADETGDETNAEKSDGNQAANTDEPESKDEPIENAIPDDRVYRLVLKEDLTGSFETPTERSKILLGSKKRPRS